MSEQQLMQRLEAFAEDFTAVCDRHDVDLNADAFAKFGRLDIDAPEGLGILGRRLEGGRWVYFVEEARAIRAP